MGSRVGALARVDGRFDLVAMLDQLDHPRTGLDTVPPIDTVIDFSSDSGAQNAAALAAARRAALLVGTTALSPETIEILGKTAAAVPVMIAPNTSRGVAVFTHLVAEAARLLGPRFDVSIIETHHKAKLDAPSGTARRLAEALRTRAGLNIPPDRIHSIRAGDVVGDHVVDFSGPGERIRLTHAALDRDVFARGALDAAAWLRGRPPGRYTIEQALGLP
jgi:4-hydroxy-tetrahydrodipicolinate reductase